MKNGDITDTSFLAAVESIDTGNISRLRQLLAASPDLATRRLVTPTEEGYFKNPYLLWFVANNPVRHEKLPQNIVEIAQAIIETLQKSSDSNYQHIIDYTLGLVATGRVPKECGVQIPLMEVLVNNGASVNGSVLGAVGQYNFEAAEYLLEKGCDYNLPTAVGLDRIDDITRLVKSASSSELYVSLVVASFFGRPEIANLLIEAGAPVNGSGNKEDFGGFHSHASALHQAVQSGSLKVVQLLVRAGADLDSTDTIYNGTPLDWAMHLQSEEKNVVQKEKYKEIRDYLAAQQH